MSLDKKISQLPATSTIGNTDLLCVVFGGVTSKITWANVKTVLGSSGIFVGGSGTANYIPKFTAGATIGNSAAYDDSGNIGIGLTSTGAKLHIKGAGNTSATFGLRVDSSTVNNLFWVRNDGRVEINSPLNAGAGLAGFALKVSSTTNGGIVINSSTGSSNPTLDLSINDVVSASISSNGASSLIAAADTIELRDLTNNHTMLAVSLTAINFRISNVQRWSFNSSGHFLPFVDNTYDIGDGTTDPRDVHIARYAHLKGLTASRALYLDASKNIASSSVTDTELGYVSGATSNLQAQINALVTGLSWKQAVRVATTAAGTLASDFENGDTVDGVVLATGDRILIKNQAAATENGIYIVQASGAPVRATDADTGAELISATVAVSAGTTNADTQWVCTNDSITIGVTNITWVAVGGTTYVGTTDRITVTGNQIDIAATYVGQATITTLGTITTGIWNAGAVTSSSTLVATTTTTSPTVQGSTAASGNLTLASTSDATKGTIIIGSSDNVTIGGATANKILSIRQDTASTYIGSRTGSTDQAVIHMNVTPNSTNYTLAGSASGTSTTLNGPTTNSNLFLAINGTAKLQVGANLFIFTPGAASSGAVTNWTFTGAAHTSQTASTEVIDVNFNLSATLQHATGNYATQRTFLVQPRTYSFAAASTITNAGNIVSGGAPAAGTNCTITNPLSFWSQAGLNRLDRIGTTKSNTDFLELLNTGNAVDMDGTETSILFSQYYYDATTPATVNAARISVGTEQDWTSTGATQDAYMAFKTVLNGTVGEKMRITSDGRIYGTSLHNNAGDVTGTTNQHIASGTYTPTLVNGANVSASTTYQFQWMRVGNVVTVSGKVDIDPDLTATTTILGIPLPIASNIGAEEDCSGTAVSPDVAGQCAAILGDAANNRATMEYISSDLGNQPMFITFTYEII